eukprot:Sdes_comp19265_c0_seq1m10257
MQSVSPRRHSPRISPSLDSELAQLLKSESEVVGGEEVSELKNQKLEKKLDRIMTTQRKLKEQIQQFMGNMSIPDPISPSKQPKFHPESSPLMKRQRADSAASSPGSDNSDKNELRGHEVGGQGANSVSSQDKEDKRKRQRIEAEQRRRDRMKDGIEELKRIIPMEYLTKFKSDTVRDLSQFSVLKAAGTYISEMNSKYDVEFRDEMKKRLQALQRKNNALELEIAEARK